MDKDELEKLLEKSSQEIKLTDIPSIDLYMDQVTTFIEDSLNYFKRNDEDKILTKTMINNYTKDKIIPPPIKKKYSKSHIILLIIIYHLKSILSISDIKILLNSQSFDSNDLSKLYEIFLSAQESESKTFSSNLINTLESFSPIVGDMNSNDKDQIDNLILVFILVIRAEFEKRLAEKIIDKIGGKK